MGDVVKLKGRFSKPMLPDCVLRDCTGIGLSDVLVIGTGADGHTVVSASPPDPGNALWLMEMARKRLTHHD